MAVSDDALTAVRQLAIRMRGQKRLEFGFDSLRDQPTSPAT